MAAFASKRYGGRCKATGKRTIEEHLEKRSGKENVDSRLQI